MGKMDDIPERLLMVRFFIKVNEWEGNEKLFKERLNESGFNKQSGVFVVKELAEWRLYGLKRLNSNIKSALKQLKDQRVSIAEEEYLCRKITKIMETPS
jgi:hypothetical protein